MPACRRPSARDAAVDRAVVLRAGAPFVAAGFFTTFLRAFFLGYSCSQLGHFAARGWWNLWHCGHSRESIRSLCGSSANFGLSAAFFSAILDLLSGVWIPHSADSYRERRQVATTKALIEPVIDSLRLSDDLRVGQRYLQVGDANSAEYIARFKGDRFAGIEGINVHATGDGHRLAEEAGAKLVNMDVTYGPELRFVAPRHRTLQDWLPSRGLGAWLLGRMLPLTPRWALNAFIRRLLVTWQHPEDALFDDGALLVNGEGCRFCDERVSPDREIALANQPGKLGYIVLDERLIERYARWPHFVSTAPRIAYAYVADYLRLRPDVAVMARSPRELAARRGLPPEVLAETIEAADAESPRDARPRTAGDRWVLLGPVKAYFTTTEGGAAIDEEFRVLDVEGRPIPGLHAVGQNGLGGQVLWGHGLHIAWAITSGRLVGRQLGRLA
jgi:hypothetical protein